VMPLLRSAAGHASRTDEVPALPGVGRRNDHRISPAPGVPGGVLRLDASTDASSLCVLAPNAECSEIYCRYFYDPPLVPRPATYAALQTARNASGCVLVLDAPQVRLRPASVPQTPLPRPQHHQRHRPGHLCGNGGTEDKASGDDLSAR